MSRRDVFLVLAALVAGLFGGVVSGWVFMSRVIVVRTPILPADVIRAERFEVVSKDGKIQAVLGESAKRDSEGDPIRNLIFATKQQ